MATQRTIHAYHVECKAIGDLLDCKSDDLPDSTETKEVGLMKSVYLGNIRVSGKDFELDSYTELFTCHVNGNVLDCKDE